MYKGIIEENGVAKLMQVWVYSLLSVMWRIGFAGVRALSIEEKNPMKWAIFFGLQARPGRVAIAIGMKRR